MQIRPVSSFAAFAITPRVMRMGSSDSRPGSGAASAVDSTESSNWNRTDGTQRSADGDTFTPQHPSASKTKAARSQRELSREDQAKVRELKTRDTEVRAHENAHKAAAGGLARGGPNYEYKTGPDGKRYAVAGDVQIDMSPGRTPEETVAKAQRIRSAGLAPAEPSGQDRAVVAQAAQMEAKARSESAQATAGDTSPSSANGNRSPTMATNDRPRLDLVA